MKKSIAMLAVLLFCSIGLSAQTLAPGARKAGTKVTATTSDSLTSGIRKDTTISLYKNEKGSQYIIGWSEKTQKHYIIWLGAAKKTK